MVTPITSATSTASTAAVAGTTSAQAQTDRFMKLLVAQLNNQDPMNPMDNSQMTSQIAQINTVSGIQDLNTTIKSMASQFTSMQVLQGASLIGHETLADGNTLSLDAGVGKGALNLASGASAVTLKVYTPGGQLLDTVNMGAMTAGNHNFDWDASKYTGSGAPTFTVTATQGSQAITSSTLVRDNITSVNSNAGAMTVSLKSGTSVAYDSIKAIL